MEFVPVPRAVRRVALHKLGIAPTSIVNLGSDQELDAASCCIVIGQSRRNERYNGPCGLDRGRRSGDKFILTRAIALRFAPTARFTLMHQEPIQARGHRTIIARCPGRQQTAGCPRRPVDEPGVSRAVPAAIGSLGRTQKRFGLLARFLVAGAMFRDRFQQNTSEFGGASLPATGRRVVNAGRPCVVWVPSTDHPPSDC